jgi:hypothetical protein
MVSSARAQDVGSLFQFSDLQQGFKMGHYRLVQIFNGRLERFAKHSYRQICRLSVPHAVFLPKAQRYRYFQNPGTAICVCLIFAEYFIYD